MNSNNNDKSMVELTDCKEVEVRLAVGIITIIIITIIIITIIIRCISRGL